MYLFRIAVWLLLVFQLPVAGFCQQQNRDSVLHRLEDSIMALKKRFLKLGNLVYPMQDKVRIQALELGMYRELKKMDSTTYGRDSLLIYFIGANGRLLKKIKLGYAKDRSAMTDIRNRRYYADSVITYFNKNGEPSYKAFWEETYKDDDRYGQQLHKDTVIYWTKPAYARYEYDDQNRLTKCVKVYSREAVSEISVSYDPQGKAIYNAKRIDEWHFWGDLKDVLKD